MSQQLAFKLVFLSLFVILVSCKDENSMANSATTPNKSQVKTSENPSQKMGKSKKPNIWVHLDANLDLSEKQLKALKKIDKQRKMKLKQLKSSPKKEIQKVLSEYRKKEIKLLGEKKYNKKKILNARYKNPISTYNLRRELNLKPEQSKEIARIKKEFNQKTKDYDSRKQFLEEREAKILSVLPPEKNKKYEQIKSKFTKSNLKLVPFQ